MSRPRIVVAVAAVVLLVVGLLAYSPALTRGRVAVETTVTPPPIDVTTMIPLRPGQRACASDVALSPESQVAVIVVDHIKTPSPALEVSARGSGYDSGPARIDGGVSGRLPLRARFRPPPAALFGDLCVRNVGERPANIVGTEEFRTQSRSTTSVEGRTIDADMTLILERGEATSVRRFLPDMVERMAAFRGLLGAEWLLWPLLVLVVAGVPLAVLFVLYRAGVADERGDQP